MKIVACKSLPARAEAGVGYLRAGGFYIGMADGSLVEVGELFSASRITRTTQGSKGEAGERGVAGRDGTNGRDGKDGAPGESISGPKGDRGERGAAGLNGRDGIDGKDGARGDKGDRGETGARGEKGERGDVLYIGAEEVKQAAAELRAQKLKMHAAILAARVEAADLPPALRLIMQQRLDRLKTEAGLEDVK